MQTGIIIKWQAWLAQYLIEQGIQPLKLEGYKLGKSKRTSNMTAEEKLEMLKEDQKFLDELMDDDDLIL
ncbi:MAG TPA: hypothetical protein VLZ11_00220 [Flavobacterium sp.]|nr:hypothetical protein [Flavobacterium sp.]